MSFTINNAFSLNMVSSSVEEISPRFRRIRVEEVGEMITSYHQEFGEWPVNAIGHPTTDEVVRDTLLYHMEGLLPPGDRMTVSLEEGDLLLVAQYKGPRLQEGACTLPEGATIEWWEVTL